jgi:hypothetical protein
MQASMSNTLVGERDWPSGWQCSKCVLVGASAPKQVLYQAELRPDEAFSDAYARVHSDHALGAHRQLRW